MNALLSNCKQNITSLSLLAGTTVGLREIHDNVTDFSQCGLLVI